MMLRPSQVVGAGLLWITAVSPSLAAKPEGQTFDRPNQPRLVRWLQSLRSFFRPPPTMGVTRPAPPTPQAVDPKQPALRNLASRLEQEYWESCNGSTWFFGYPQLHPVTREHGWLCQVDGDLRFWSVGRLGNSTCPNARSKEVYHTAKAWYEAKVNRAPQQEVAQLEAKLRELAIPTDVSQIRQIAAVFDGRADPVHAALGLPGTKDLLSRFHSRDPRTRDGLVCALRLGRLSKREYGLFRQTYGDVDELCRVTIPVVEEIPLQGSRRHAGLVHNYSPSKEARQIAEKVAQALEGPVMNGYHGELPRIRKHGGYCNIGTSDLQSALRGLGFETKKVHGYGHWHLRHGDLIIDPTIIQYIKHKGMDGVFIGTAQNLADFVRTHPGKLEKAGRDPQGFTNKTWKIDPDWWGVSCL